MLQLKSHFWVPTTNSTHSGSHLSRLRAMVQQFFIRTICTSALSMKSIRWVCPSSSRTCSHFTECSDQQTGDIRRMEECYRCLRRAACRAQLHSASLGGTPSMPLPRQLQSGSTWPIGSSFHTCIASRACRSCWTPCSLQIWQSQVGGWLPFIEA